MLRFLASGLATFLWPPCCPACTRPEEVDALCGPCRALVARLPADERASAGVAGTRRVALLRYEGVPRELLLALKYRGTRHAARGLVELLLEELPGSEKLGFPDLVVPVPAGWRRIRVRGFNQAALLARPLARTLGLPLGTRHLRRIRDAGAQVGRGHGARRRALAGAFAARSVLGHSVLLVDDVVTTGSTLDACTQALLAAGARRVTALALMRTDLPA